MTMKAGDGLSAPVPGMVLPSRPFRQLRWLQVTHQFPGVPRNSESEGLKELLSF